MRIVIVHYHLNPGGVTRVIHSQIESILQRNVSVLLLTGYVHKDFQSPKVEVVEESALNYLNGSGLEKDYLQSRLDRIIEIFRKYVKNEDVLHIHNLNLGKNPLLTLAMNKLVGEGYKVLNHCHDFAEDRPEQWQLLHEVINQKFNKDLDQILYPESENLCYGVLNRADFARLKKKNIAEDRIFYLPNPVAISLPAASETCENICEKLLLDKSKKIVTYPVRVIRRKNIGEYILLAVLLKEQANWLVTLPPKNPVEIEPYEEWKTFCRAQNINIKFEAGEQVGYEHLIRFSDFCITTSYREGFGLVYLEPWLLQTPVVGRKLSYITDDLKKSGLKFQRLYERIEVSFNGEILDFKDLKPSGQKEFITDISSGKIDRNKILEGNPFLNNLLDKFPEEIIEANKQTIINQYSTEEYGKRLFAAYQKISG